MNKWKIIVLTDHLSHNPANSVYELCNALQRDERVGEIMMASRGQAENAPFFYQFSEDAVWAAPVNGTLNYEWGQQAFESGKVQKVALQSFDLIWLRLPRPIPTGFFEFLEARFKNQIILNRPLGIQKSGSKEFLLEVPDLCPPIRLCRNLADIKDFQQAFPIVLKPLEDYGGRGILRVEKGQVLLPEGPVSLDDYAAQLQTQFDLGGYLAMEFLPGVREGDKRVVVVNGHVIGGLLRMPAEGSWLCNAAQGGRAVVTKVDPEERDMAARLHEKLGPLGIAIFGMDTLMGNVGKRVLSEVNALSIGGIQPLGELTDIPASDLVIKHFIDFAESLKKNAATEL
ncbi:MAG: glutathione synthetase [Saprospiraceae bacterium]|nr:glutathione synthetase [Saprospiraceae bacterium]